MSTSLDVTRELYERWSTLGVASLAEQVDPEVRLICDPLRPDEPLCGLEGWHRWAARWDEGYDGVRITPDALIPIGESHVLAFVTIAATPAGGGEPLEWAAAHVWTFREDRITGWQAHLDLDAARATLGSGAQSAPEP